MSNTPPAVFEVQPEQNGSHPGDAVHKILEHHSRQKNGPYSTANGKGNVLNPSGAILPPTADTAGYGQQFDEKGTTLTGPGAHLPYSQYLELLGYDLEPPEGVNIPKTFQIKAKPVNPRTEANSDKPKFRPDPQLREKAREQGRRLRAAEKLFQESTQNPQALFEAVVDGYELMTQQNRIGSLPQAERKAFEQDRSIFERSMLKVIGVAEYQDEGKTKIDPTKLIDVAEELDIAAEAFQLMFLHYAKSPLTYKVKTTLGSKSVSFSKHPVGIVAEAINMYSDSLVAQYKEQNPDAVSADTEESTEFSEMRQRRIELEEEERLRYCQMASSEFVSQALELSQLQEGLKSARPQAARQFTAESLIWKEEGMPNKTIDFGIVDLAVRSLEMDLIEQEGEGFTGTPTDLEDRVKLKILQSEPFYSKVLENRGASKILNQLTNQELLMYKTAARQEELNMLQVVLESYEGAQTAIIQQAEDVLYPRHIDVDKVRTLCAEVLHAGLLADFQELKGNEGGLVFFNALGNWHQEITQFVIPTDREAPEFKNNLQRLNQVTQEMLEGFEGALGINPKVKAETVNYKGDRQPTEFEFNQVAHTQLEQMRCVGESTFDSPQAALNSFPEGYVPAKVVINEQDIRPNTASSIVPSVATERLGSFEIANYNLSALISTPSPESPKARLGRKNEILALLE